MNLIFYRGKLGYMIAGSLLLLLLGVAARGVTPQSAKPEAGVPKFALLIGLTNFKNQSINRIDGCENNVPLLAETLVNDYGFEKQNVLSVLNENATKQNIIKSFKSHLVGNARKSREQGKEATVVYYFCGHGSQTADQDKDENDGLDETFVTYDSRTDDVPDMRDDELDDLKHELFPLTHNALYILESCHSGTASRTDEQYISQEVAEDTKQYKPYKRKYAPTKEDETGFYTEIAASMSSLTAKSESREFCRCTPYSLMTKALVEGLKRATNTTTYRALVRDVATAVSKESQQEPQVEGNKNALLFDGAAKKAKPFIEIEKLNADGSINIFAGKAHGLKPGAQVAVYSEKSLTNTGDENWLANGTITEVNDFRSVVRLPKADENTKAKEINEKSHVVLTAPVFGGGPMVVSVLPFAGQTASPAEAQLLNRIENSLKAHGALEAGLVKIVPQTESANTARSEGGQVNIRRAKFKDAFLNRSQISLPRAENEKCAPNPPAPDTEVYYLDDGAPGGPPLYGKYFLPGEDGLAENIAYAVKTFAMQSNLRSIDNAASNLGRYIKVTLQTDVMKETVNCVDGKAERSYEDAVPVDAKTNQIKAGTTFRFKIQNISGDIRRKKDEFASGERLFVTALLISNDGGIKVIYSASGANDPLEDGITVDTGVLKATEPVGVEQLKIIVTKQYVDFSFYGLDGVRAPGSILEQLLMRSGSKRDGILIPDQPDQWGVKTEDIYIVENKPV